MVRKLTAVGLAFAIATWTVALSHGGQFDSLIASSFAATRPSGPNPPPPPSGICDNCGGTGKLGDGTIKVSCPVCGGDGKLNTSEPQDAAPRPPAASGHPAQPAAGVTLWPEYPTRSVSGSRWTYNGGQITAAHLANPNSHHAHEHFDRQWLNTLSNAQLTALGSDAHEGRVRERFVVRSSHAAPAKRATADCPTGNCPSPAAQRARRGLFGGFFRR